MRVSLKLSKPTVPTFDASALPDNLKRQIERMIQSEGYQPLDAKPEKGVWRIRMKHPDGRLAEVIYSEKARTMVTRVAQTVDSEVPAIVKREMESWKAKGYQPKSMSATARNGYETWTARVQSATGRVMEIVYSEAAKTMITREVQKARDDSRKGWQEIPHYQKPKRALQGDCPE